MFCSVAVRTSGRAAKCQALARKSERAATLFFSHPDFNRRLWNFTKSTAEPGQSAEAICWLVGSRALPPAQIFTDPEELCYWSIFTLNRARCQIVSGLQPSGLQRLKLAARGGETHCLVDSLESLFGLLVGPLSTHGQQSIKFGRVRQEVFGSRANRVEVGNHNFS